MDRRSLLKLLATGVTGFALDVDKLLWIPGQKKFFLPSKKVLTATDIVIAEWERIIPKIHVIFERNDIFYRLIKQESFLTLASKEMNLPFQIEEV